MVEHIERRAQISRRDFFLHYLCRNRPIIVTDAMQGWALAATLDFKHLADRYGHLTVQLQKDFFDFTETSLLADYLRRLPEFEAAVGSDGEVSAIPPYLRYALGPGGFTAEVFRDIQEKWHRPYFLPKHFYIYPFELLQADPTTRTYPDFGVYVSPRGAITRLHVDGDGSNTVLHQIHGRKRVFLFPPDAEPMLPKDWPQRSKKRYNINAPPDYDGAVALEAVLEPGEILFIPRCWFHEVYTLERSISLTFCFVHLGDGFLRWGPHPTWVFGYALPHAYETFRHSVSALFRKKAAEP
jgi:hypothetical protein